MAHNRKIIVLDHSYEKVIGHATFTDDIEDLFKKGFQFTIVANVMMEVDNGDRVLISLSMSPVPVREEDIVVPQKRQISEFFGVQQDGEKTPDQS
jgi:hypothetical protein